MNRHVEVKQQVTDDTVILSNANTTIGYARFSPVTRTIDYVFVNPSFRRQGYGCLLVSLSERHCGVTLAPAAPLSPLGNAFFQAIGRGDGGSAGKTRLAP